MSEPNFTKGPWRVEQGGISSKDGYADVLYVESGTIYSEYTSDPPSLVIPNEANAALIAAAPDMLEALEAVVASSPIEDSVLPIVFAAIFKARGEQP